MIRQWFSMITEDDNPRLHHTPFLLLWVAAYGLGWLFIYIFEHPASLSREICDFSFWLRGGYGFTSVWRTHLFIGLLVGLALSLVQGWLLKRRFGFVPKYWTLATIIGAMVGGLGYPSLGSSVGGYFSPPVDRIFIWFSVMNLTQAIIVLRTSRQGWIIGLVGIISACLAVGIIYVDQSLSNLRLGIIIGTVAQAVGTGLIILYVMARPRQGIVPKRDSLKKTKHQFNKQISAISFVMLWIAIFCIAQAVILLLDEMPPQLRFSIPFYDLLFAQPDYYTYYMVLRLAISGIILGVGQQWLLKQYSRATIRYWQWFTMLGWFIVGTLTMIIRPNNSFISETHGYIVGLAWFMIPTLFQSILMNRAIRFGWIWIISGLSAGILQIFILNPYPSSSFRYFWYLPSIFIGGLTLSIVTALIFLWINSRQDQTQSESNLHN